MITAEEWYANPEYLDFGPHKIFYKEAGSGDPILFLHGFPTTSWDWQKMWPELTAKHRCVVFDFLGFGYSSKPKDHVYTIHEQADVAEAAIRRAGLKKFKLIAHDYGNTVGQELLARQHENPGYEIESTIFFNGGLFPETHRARLIQKLLLSPIGPVLNALFGYDKFAKSLNGVFGPQTQASDEEMREFWRLFNYPDGKSRLAHKLIRYMADRRQHRERWVDALRKSPGPIRLINGPLDPVSGAHLVERYREVVDPNVDAIFLENIGHYPQVEDPQGSLAGIFGFKAGGYS